METEVKTNSGMGCFEHPEKTVVATCAKCGKFMCRECAEKNESKLCDSCEAERVKKEKENLAQRKEQLKSDSKDHLKMTQKQLIGQLVKTGIGAAIGLFVGLEAGSFGMVILYMYMFGGFPWGWSFVKNAIDTGDWAWFAVIFNNVWLLIFGIFFKLALAMLIGLVAMPIGIFRAVKDFKEAKKFDGEVKEMK